MKTVMKKMFCLMLVAVLMVGVMPFQAFAAEYNVTAVVTLNSQPVTTLPSPVMIPAQHLWMLGWHKLRQHFLLKLRQLPAALVLSVNLATL